MKLYFLAPIFCISCCILIVSIELINFRKNFYSKGNKSIIKYKKGVFHFIYQVLLFIFVFFNLNTSTKQDLILYILLLITIVIIMPFEYLNNRICLYEQGIFLPVGKLRLVKSVPYNEIETFEFLEYEKGKFILTIKPLNYKKETYRIKLGTKEKITSFIKAINPEYKFSYVKEY
ncbi:hypothetical protein [Clostridium uliginosum]|uniref:DUF5673 domain-containing protein n=1 Tax=Clostridium uliginosum TaxID=119641 RepID=A0A1I1HAG0_9CLOT|nr:hypothetical protein [Clostridium uliginosum]SFC21129.1 hypothetical protein SAMN05421842_101245 [Clostridium uliginosum]